MFHLPSCSTPEPFGDFASPPSPPPTLSLRIPLEFDELIGYMLQSPELLRFNPIVLNTVSANLLDYLLKTRPEFFPRFQTALNAALTHDDKFDLSQIAPLLLLFRFLKQTVVAYKMCHFLAELHVPYTCRKLLAFLLYTLILDERIVLEDDARFIEKITDVFDATMF